MKEVWYTKYRPRTVEEYVFRDNNVKEKVQEWIEKKRFGNILLMGSSGTGKTSLAKLLVEQCGFDDSDVRYIDASITNGVDDIRNLVVNFAERSSFGTNGRVVVLDECDMLSNSAQAALRNIIGESQAQFILIGNYPHKIIPALKSRCTPITFEELERDSFLLRMIDVLEAEGIAFDEPTLMEHFERNYPDLRKTISALEFHTVGGKLSSPSNVDDVGTDAASWMELSIVYFADGKLDEARKLILDNIGYDDYDYFYNYLYKHTDMFAQGDADKRDACIIAIADALVNDTVVANREINLSACLAKLGRIYRK